MAYFPMFVELEGRPCLIVGGGAVALRKARKLLPYGPCLTVVAQSFVPELEALEAATLMAELALEAHPVVMANPEPEESAARTAATAMVELPELDQTELP